MDHADAVRVDERLRELSTDGRRLVRGERAAAGEHGAEVAAGDVLRGDEGDALDLAVVVDRHDVRGVQP